MERTILIVLVLCVSVYSVHVRVDPLVLVNGQGLVRGQRTDDGQYSMFLGIPYARVDIDNPFGAAQNPSPFEEEIFNANDGTAKCPQMSDDDSTSLDCLKMNIFVPIQASSRNPLPVLFWIHGGEFHRGSASDYSGVRDIVRHGVVVVAINYRLGPYGFLCLDVPSVHGNQGLKDQFQALQWVRNNIASFGGNPYNVTIAGQDAGAVSTLLHLYSSRPKLFHKAIIESGTPQTDGMFSSGDVDAAIKIAERLGFNTTDTGEALAYLVRTDHDLVAVAAQDLGLNLKPCRERSISGLENFIEDDPYDLSNRIKIRNTRILIGYTNKERDELNDDYFNTDPFYEKIVNNFNLEEDVAIRAANMVKHFYLGDRPITREVESQLEDFESDFTFNHPTHRTIDSLLSENAGAIYEYLFSYVGDSNAEGASHNAELNYLFQFTNEERSENDQLIVDRMTTLWTNFIKYGNPTTETTDLVPIIWPEVTEATRPALVIDIDLREEDRVDHERMAFWDLFYTVYGRYTTVARGCSMMNNNEYQ